MNPSKCSSCGGHAQYYMVWNHVWLAACPDYRGSLHADGVKRQRPREKNYHWFMCFTCLEKGIGRELTLEDFTHAPVNHGISRVLAEHRQGAIGGVLQ